MVDKIKVADVIASIIGMRNGSELEPILSVAEYDQTESYCYVDPKKIPKEKKRAVSLLRRKKFLLKSKRVFVFNPAIFGSHDWRQSGNFTFEP